MESTLTGSKILIVDDDELILAMLTDILSEAGVHVFTASDARTGWQDIQTIEPDLVISDLMMPGVDGFELCRWIRQRYQTPILIFSGGKQDTHIVRVLRLGADDYLVKPSTPEILIVRLEALLRRSQNYAQPKATLDDYQDGYLTINLTKRQVSVNKVIVKLSDTEYRLLAYLFNHADRVVPWADILTALWGPEYANSPEYIHRYISFLRRKLEVDPSTPRYLITHRGVGYLFQTLSQETFS